MRIETDLDSAVCGMTRTIYNGDENWYAANRWFLCGGSPRGAEEDDQQMPWTPRCAEDEPAKGGEE